MAFFTKHLKTELYVCLIDAVLDILRHFGSNIIAK